MATAHRGAARAQHPPAGAAPDPAGGVAPAAQQQQQPRGRRQEVSAGYRARPEAPRQEGGQARRGGVRRAGVLDVPRAERPAAAAVPRQEGRGRRGPPRRRRRDARPQAHPAAGVIDWRPLPGSSFTSPSPFVSSVRSRRVIDGAAAVCWF